MTAPPSGPRRMRQRRAQSVARTIELAAAARAAGQLGDSFAACKDILVTDPANVDALLCLAQIARMRGDADAALDFIAAACRNAPARGDLFLEQARVHIARGDLVDAERELRAAIHRNAGLEAILALIDLLIVERRFDEARELADSACAHTPTSVDAHQRRANLQRLAGNVCPQPERTDGLRHARRLRCLIERNLGASRRKLVAVELGCGQGAAGSVWRPVAAHLIAVEADEASASTARLTGLYDMVTTASPAQHLAELPENLFDLVAAPVALTRTLALSPFFAGAARTLRRGGLFALALQADARGAEVTILPGQRFRHSQMSLRRLAEAYGFDTVALARLSERGRGSDGNSALLAVLRNNRIAS